MSAPPHGARLGVGVSPARPCQATPPRARAGLRVEHVEQSPEIGATRGDLRPMDGAQANARAEQILVVDPFLVGALVDGLDDLAHALVGSAVSMDEVFVRELEGRGVAALEDGREFDASSSLAGELPQGVWARDEEALLVPPQADRAQPRGGVARETGPLDDLILPARFEREDPRLQARGVRGRWTGGWRQVRWFVGVGDADEPIGGPLRLLERQAQQLRDFAREATPDSAGTSSNRGSTDPRRRGASFRR